jgi:hypothetical protein
MGYYVAKRGMCWAGFQGTCRVTGWHMTEDAAEDALDNLLDTLAK